MCCWMTGPSQRVLLPYFQDILRELSSEQPDYLEVCAGILDVLLLKLSRRTCMDVSREDMARISSGCAEAKRLIDEHFQEEITLDWLAQQSGISKYYLSRTFHTYFSISPCSTCASGAFMRRVTCSPPPITARMPSPSCAAFPHPATFRRLSNA